MEKIENVDQYIAQFPEKIRKVLTEMRNLIKETAPEAEEVISYGMPAFKIYGRQLVYYAAHTNHLGYYPAGVSTIELFTQYGYKGTKGSVHFPYGEPIPTDLIRKSIIQRVDENYMKKNEKKK